MIDLDGVFPRCPNAHQDDGHDERTGRCDVWTNRLPVHVEGPAWCEPGLLARAGRYPLAVEAPVMAAVNMLVPGVSTVTRYARYYSLYWALAAYAEAVGLNRDGCRRLVRRAEVGMARISQRYDEPEHPLGLAHGVNALTRLTPTDGADGRLG